jgi:hypothetical protein
MKKYLFTDGTNVIREVQSEEELQSLIQSSGDPGKIRIWIFNTNEWVTHAEFNKHRVAKVNSLKNPPAKEEKKDEAVGRLRTATKPRGWSRLLILLITAAAIFLVYNFTRIKWRKISPLEITASRPNNVPLMDVDSLIQEIEFARGQKIDRVTATNLRIRNTWPDRMQLQLKSEREVSNGDTKFYNVNLFIDNSTGYNIDQAIVEVTTWENDRDIKADTVHFDFIGYAAPATRDLPVEFRGDSLSVSFVSLRSKAFNFCYSAGKESNYGNLNDRWFCKE